MNDDSCNIQERTPLSLCYVCALIRPVISDSIDTFLDGNIFRCAFFIFHFLKMC